MMIHHIHDELLDVRLLILVYKYPARPALTGNRQIQLVFGKHYHIGDGAAGEFPHLIRYIMPLHHRHINDVRAVNDVVPVGFKKGADDRVGIGILVAHHKNHRHIVVQRIFQSLFPRA